MCIVPATPLHERYEDPQLQPIEPDQSSAIHASKDSGVIARSSLTTLLLSHVLSFAKNGLQRVLVFWGRADDLTRYAQRHFTGLDHT